MKKEIIIASSVIVLAIVGCQQKQTDTTGTTYRSSAATNTISEPAGAARRSMDTNSLNSLTNDTNSVSTSPAPTPDQTK